jgi:hypothetical protein
MSGVFFLAGGSSGANGKVISLDVNTDVEGTFPVKVTSHPIEGGGNVSDHMIKENATFTIKGAVSNANFVESGNHLANNPMVPLDAPNRSVKAFQELQKIRDRGILFTLLTSYGTFRNCAMTEFKVTESSGFSGDSVLMVDIKIEQLRIFSSESIVVGVAATLNIADQEETSGGKSGTGRSRTATMLAASGIASPAVAEIIDRTAQFQATPLLTAYRLLTTGDF